MADSLKEFAAGTAGGFAGKLLDYPLDTVKVLLQTQSETKVYNGAWHCLRHTVQTKGVRGLYKGLSSPLLGSMAENAVLFVSYGFFQSLYNKPTEQVSLFELSMAGAGAGGVVSFVLTPVELVKCRLQVTNSARASFAQYKGPIDVVVQTIRNEGVAALYRGHVSTFLREVPGNFCWYGVYEGTCMALTPEGKTKADLGPSAHLLGGAMAGVAYWTAFYPADTVKSQIQTNSSGSTFWRTFVDICRTQGMRGLYRGWGITAMRAAPAHAVIFAMYEYTIKLLKPKRPPEDPNSTSFVMHESIRD